MEQKLDTCPSGVDSFPAVARSALVSDELRRIREMLKDAHPDAVHISFEFVDKLQAHVDVRTKEEVSVIEFKLPMLGAGLFTDIRRGKTPNHPFCHRVSAQVLR